MNEERVANGEEAYMNPRNTASWFSLKITRIAVLVGTTAFRVFVVRVSLAEDLGIDTQFQC